MRNQASWDEQDKNLRDAKVLAEFANLEPDGVDRFRAAHPDFFPQSWWDYEPTYTGDTNPASTGFTLRKQWQITQKFLREAWQSQFEIELYDHLKILQSIFNPDVIPPMNARTDPVFGGRWTEPVYRPAFADMWDILWDRDQTKPPYYLAIKFLSGNGWRAKTCKWKPCGKRFIAEHSRGKFCSFGTVDDGGNETTCFWAKRKKDKAENWSDHSKQTNERRRREYRRDHPRRVKAAKLKRTAKRLRA